MKKRLSTRAYLFGLVAAVVVPLLAFAIYLFLEYASLERSRLEANVGRTARQVALVLDAQLSANIAALQGLTASTAFVEGDLRAFHAEAVRLAQARGALIILRDFATGQLLNSDRPFGTALPPAVSLNEEDRRLLEAGTTVSNVYKSPISGEPRIAVATTVRDRGGKELILSLTLPTSQIRDAIAPAVPPGWIVGVGDRNGIYVARSARHKEVSGQPGLPEYLNQLVGESGTFLATNFDGGKVLAGYYRSRLSGWMIGANVPQDIVTAPLRRSLMALAAFGAAAIALSTMLALWFSRPFTAAAASLARSAGALGRGETPRTLDRGPSEFLAVSEALSGAARAIEERDADRARHEEQRDLLVNELNHRVKNTLATVQSLAAQTLRNPESLDAARVSFTDRLMALANAHNVLTRENWKGADLRETITSALSPFAQENRVTIQGPQVWLSPTLTLSLSLALHELATNALKYGSLSAERGTVSIHWDYAGAAEKLILTWRERGGPPVSSPTRIGFGSRLIRRTFAAEAGGSVSVSYAPTGFVCTMEVAGLPSPAAAPSMINMAETSATPLVFDEARTRAG
jgi:two-component sensor histidine kinase